MNRLRRAAREVAVRSADAAGLLAALRWFHRDQVTILCYHSVVQAELPRWVAYGGLHLSAGDFGAHVRHLVKHYAIQPLSRIAAAMQSGEALPPRTLALTFDDGYANNVARAAPVLREAGVRATLFLATEYIGQTDVFWWDELGLILSSAAAARYEVDEAWGAIDLRSDAGFTGAIGQARTLLDGATRAGRRDLLDRLGAALGLQGTPSPFHEELRPAGWSELETAADVFEYGAHTAGHRVLDLLKEGDARDEIRRCGRDLDQHVGRSAVPVFSYPAGRHNESVVGAVRDAGFHAAVTTRPGPLSRFSASDAWRLPRIPITTGTSPALLAARIAGLARFGSETR